MIVFRDFNRKTIWVGSAEASVATLGGFIGPWVLSFGSECDIVINKLTPGDEKDGNGMVVEAFVSVNVGGDDARGRKRIASYGSTWGRDAIGVIRGKETMVTVHGGAPMRMLEIVAETFDRSVALNMAFGSHEEGRAVVLYITLGGIDERKTIGNGILR